MLNFKKSVILKNKYNFEKSLMIRDEKSNFDSFKLYINNA